MTNVRLILAGNEYTGWEEVYISRSMEALCASFSLNVSYDQPFPIKEGESAQVFIDGDKIIDGYIDSINESVTESSSTVSIKGRDKTCDLIDASALHESQEFKDIEFQNLLEIIARPFGISVDIQVQGLKKFSKFSLQQETAFEALERASRLRGVFLNSDQDGNLIVQEYAKQRASGSLIVGENLESFSRISDFTNRFSEYIVRGQHQGNDNLNGEAAASPEGRSIDNAVGRYRPLIIQAEDNIDNNAAQTRADWESSVRKARSVEYKARVTGWRQSPQGELWSVNQVVPVEFEQRKFKEDLLIKDVQFVLNGSTGLVTELVLTSPDVFSIQ